MKKDIIKDTLGEYNDKVVMASEIPVPETNPDDVSGVLNGMPETDNFITLTDAATHYLKEKWYKEIEDYCASLSITPTELLTQHSELMKKGLKTKKVRPDNNYGVYDRNKIKLEKVK